MFAHSRSRGLMLSAIYAFFLLSTSAVADIGRLKQVVDIGDSDGWNGRLESGTYWLENAQEPGAIRYYHTSYTPAEGGQREISVNVRVQADDPQARAGLLYGYDAETRSYYLILLGPKGQFEVVRRDASGFQLRMSSTTGADGTSFNRITVRENGNEIALSVNDKDLGSLGNDTIGKGAVGIVAAGLGRFGFSNYREAAASSGQADPTIQSPGMPETSKQDSNEKKVKHVIRDQFGFEKPMDALTVTLPEGWDVKGSVQWYGNPYCAFNLPKFHFMATAPNGKQWVEFLPGGVWTWTSTFDAAPQLARQGVANCDAKNITDIQGFVDQYIPKIRPGATIIGSRPRPDYAEEASAELMKEMRKQNNPNMHARAESMEVRVTYQANGNTINEMLAPVVVFLDQPAPDLYGGMTGYVTVAIALGTLTTATVDGPADDSLIELIGDNMENNPAYTARLERHYNDRAKMMAEANARRLAANRAYQASRASNWKVDKSGSEILDMQMETYKNTSKMNEAGHSSGVDMIHERQPWQNSGGQTIYMPQQYQRVYQLPNEVYVGTNDPFFNPVETFGEFGTPMQPAGK